MAPLSLKIVLDDGAVTRTVMFDSTMKVARAQEIVNEKILTAIDTKDYGLFLTSADNEKSGIWLEGHRPLDYYMLRDGDQLQYFSRVRNLRVRMLDGSVKTMQVDESKTVEQLMVDICARIGITNYDEYGLCKEDEDQEETKPASGMGTLTLRRATAQRERDAKMQQLSKKLKTDDNVEWLDQHKTLREMGVEPRQTLLLKRRLFYTDRNVDARDPVQLNLLYVQTRDAILEGRHPVTEEQAVQFAGIQCQIHFGDYQEDKHKPGLIENLSEYLATQYSGSRSIEKKILKEFSKHQGLSQLEAKHLYIKTARALPTYGVTFFLVKEQQKGKKKLVPRLLGINAEAILRLDEVTKEVLQVWPLTQVKTYHAGKSETFTLNFGDYSDKEYSVKTNDAHRIRDILQGYIDIIKKRMEAKYNVDSSEYHAIFEDNVQASKGNTTEFVKIEPSKVVEESFVGPSKIITYEPGQAIAQGTQIVTVQQVVVSGKGSNEQKVLVSEVPMRKDLPMDFVRKLNRLNSNSVKVVTFLTEPNEGNMIEARKVVETMQTDMPSITEGVQAAAAKMTTEEGKKNLLDALEELSDCMRKLGDSTSGNVNPEDAQEAARRIADLSTQMYFSLDPKTKTRQHFCRRSRKSFIQDDKTDATLKRASILVATQTACSTIDKVKQDLQGEAQAVDLEAAAIAELERAALDKMGKLNAAVALYLTAFADPNNVDYSAAVTNMHTINELLPELAKDAKVLSGVKDGNNREDLLDDIRALCDAAGKICSLSSPDDHKQMQEAAGEYGAVSEKLIFTLRRRPHNDKQYEIIKQANEVAGMTSQLLTSSHELATDPAAADLDAAEVRCSDAAKDLIACATLTAPSIHEPHCQSALTAAAENLSSAVQNLKTTWKPLLEDPSRGQLADNLGHQYLDLTKALDRLKDACASLNGVPEEEDESKESRRLKFITSLSKASHDIDAAEKELEKPLAQGVVPSEELKERLRQKIAELSAALAALATATADRDNPDYATAELATGIIGELMPEIMKVGAQLSCSEDAGKKEQMLAELRALCDTTKDICVDSAQGNPENFKTASVKFANIAGKLCATESPSNNEAIESINKLSLMSSDEGSKLSQNVSELVSRVDAKEAADLSNALSKLRDAADNFQNVIQITAPCLQEPKNIRALKEAADQYALANQQLAAAWEPLVQRPELEELRKQLQTNHRILGESLHGLKTNLDDLETNVERLKFIKSMAACADQVKNAERELLKPIVAPKTKTSSEELKTKLYESMGQLSAAVGALLAATSDQEKLKYVKADEAIENINPLLLQVIKDAKSISAGEDERARAAMMDDLQVLCDAIRALYASSAQPVKQDSHDDVMKFADSSDRLLSFCFKRRPNKDKNKILDLSSSIQQKAHELKNGVTELTDGNKLTDLVSDATRVASAADTLIAAAKLAARTMDDQDSLDTMRLSAACHAVAENVKKIQGYLPQSNSPALRDLNDKLQQLNRDLDLLNMECRTPEDPVSAEIQRLRFISSASAAKNRVDAAEKELAEPAVPRQSTEPPQELRNNLAKKMAKLNSAIAKLLSATVDPKKPNYSGADRPMKTIGQLLPEIVKDSLSLTSEQDTAGVSDQLKALCAAARALCSAATNNDHKELTNNALKFGHLSTRMFYVFNPRLGKEKEHEIVHLSSKACVTVAMMLETVQRQAAELGGDSQAELKDRASKVHEAAKDLLTKAQLTVLTIGHPRSLDSMMHSIARLSDASDALHECYRSAQVGRDDSGVTHILGEHEKLKKDLDELKKACQLGTDADKDVLDKRKLRILRALTGKGMWAASVDVGPNIKLAERQLYEPTPTNVDSLAVVENRLARNLTQLNTAVAALLPAVSDFPDSDYGTADQSVPRIDQLMPEIVKDTRILSASKEPAIKSAMLADANQLCMTTYDIWSSVQHLPFKDLSEFAASIADCSGRLYTSPLADQALEHRILELTSSACEKTSQLLSDVYELASSTPGSPGQQLDTAGSKAADKAKMLLITSQLTAPMIHEPQCQAVMVSAASAVSSSARDLDTIWTSSAARDPKLAARVATLNEKRKEVDDAIEELKRAVTEPGIKSPTRRAPPPPPKRQGSLPRGHEAQHPGPLHKDERDINQEFLDRIRYEEARDMNTALLGAVEATENMKTDDEKALRQEFSKAVDAAVLNIGKAEAEVNKMYKLTGDVIPALTVDQTLVVQKQMEQKLALAGVAAADLVAANHHDSLDLGKATTSTTTISELMPQIAQEAKLLRGALDDKEREAFLADIQALINAAKSLVQTAKDDKNKLNECAVEFGNKSAKLLYVVSTDVDPSQEKEVFEHTRRIGDSATQVAMLGSKIAAQTDAARAKDLCDAGRGCTQAAGTLIYTAKLVAPSIQTPECQEALTKASQDLSEQLKWYTSSWKPLQSDSEFASSVHELQSETERLEGLLEGFRKDLETRKFVKRRTMERVVVEDSPLRQLACTIMEDAKRKAESTSNQPEQRQRFAKYANELAQAVKQLDLTNHRCRQSPHDANQRQHLENAVQHLQVTVLKKRPSQDGKPVDNTVDLTEYVENVLADTDKLCKECGLDLPELQDVRDHCEKIKAYGNRIVHPSSEKQGADDGMDDIEEIERFAQDCDNHVKAINSVIYDLKDGKNKIKLQEKAAQLNESCNVLRFATKSYLSTAQSVSLEATLEDLANLEARIEEMLVPGDQHTAKAVAGPQMGRERMIAACGLAGAGAASDLPPAFTAYLDHVRDAGDLHREEHKTRSKEHLTKLLQLLKTLTMTTSRHVATWQKLGQPETAVITEQILQEMDAHKIPSDKADGKHSVLDEVGVSKLLLPSQTKFNVDPKQIPEKLQQVASKLSTTAGTIILSASKPDSLARSMHVIEESACQLADLARALRSEDLGQSRKIDEAAKEMTLQTYDVLISANSVNQDPNNYASRKRLLDSCRLLNDAISKLVRITLPANKMQKECGELTRSLQLHQNLLQGTLQPSCAMNYPDCMEALQNQYDVIQKLNNDAPMPREQFTKTLEYVGAAVNNSTEYAAQCAYLLSIADQHRDVAREGFLDVSRISSLSDAVRDTCRRIIRVNVDQAKEEEPILSQQVEDLKQALVEAQEKTRDTAAQEELKNAGFKLDSAVEMLKFAVYEKTPSRAKITSSSIRVLDATKSIGYVVERVSVIPEASNVSAEAKARADEVVKSTRNLNNKMLSLIREVKSCDDDQDPMTWVVYNTSRKAVLEMFDALLNSIKENGKRAGVLESQSEEDLDQPKKSYVQIQLDLANKWLKRPASKAETKAEGELAARNIIKLAEQMTEDLKGNEKEDMQQLVSETKELLADCLKKHDHEKASQLMERLKALRKAIERGLVTRIVEDFLEGEEPLADLDILSDVEKDEKKRKLLLEQKIAELLAHLGRVTKTARLVAGAGSGGPRLTDQLLQCSDQTELLAPMLVKAAHQRVISPDDQAAIEHYQRLLAQYAESLANIRELCDQAVDPMDFVQTAGETMQRMREETIHENDPRRSVYASTAITKLANRVITVSMSSADARRDPELQKALAEVKDKLTAAVPPPNARPSRVPDWKVTTEAILQTIGEVEPVLGGESIFKKQQTSDQPIFAAALNLHTAIRGWSARDNEIVAVAKRMAVLMAKLSEYMITDRKRDLLATSKAIVTESHEVADLARKLAHECTDVRIKTNLLQACERIPTISGQLKMLATVKGSSLGHQGLKDDQEDMNTLVGNAQNLMQSVEQVVKAAESASVKIMSQRGLRMKWVRKANYY